MVVGEVLKVRVKMAVMGPVVERIPAIDSIMAVAAVVPVLRVEMHLFQHHLGRPRHIRGHHIPLGRGGASRCGDGGIGRPVPQFSAPRIPTTYMPQPIRSETGPTGLYGGGGGGGSVNSAGYDGYQHTFAGQGGTGGGGHGGGTYPRPGYGSPQRFSPESGTNYDAQTGYPYLGGGGGGASATPNSNGMSGKSGGSGVVMIRYLYPHVNT